MMGDNGFGKVRRKCDKQCDEYTANTVRIYDGFGTDMRRMCDNTMRQIMRTIWAGKCATNRFTCIKTLYINNNIIYFIIYF